MTQKWNLQDIRPAEPRKRKMVQTTDQEPRRTVEPTLDMHRAPVQEAEVPLERVEIKDRKKENKKGIAIISTIIAIIIAGVFGLSFVLSKTTLTVYPEYREVNVSAQYIAYPEKREDVLVYEILTLTEEGDQQVNATGQQNVTEQATGFIEIIKTTPGTERLIKNTRFRSPQGLIFRIQESVVVPGAVRDQTGNLIPGTIRAAVFADNVGPEYNLEAGTRFNIPGFQENNLTDLYNAIYAENRESFSGGFNGPKFIIDEAELALAKQKLHEKLRDSLLQKLETQIPATTVGFKGAIALTFESMSTIQYGEGSVAIRERAVLQQPLFNKANFASFLARETVSTYQREPVRITNIEDIIFSYSDTNTNASNLANATALEFNLTGKPQIVWEFDAEQLKTDLAGKAFTAIGQVLTGYQGINTARITGKPFWMRSFPEDPADIQIIEVIGNPAAN